MRNRSIALPFVVFSASLSMAACGGGDLVLPPGAPATVRAVSGDLQEGETGQRLPDPLVVAVEDQGGRPIAGSRIVFRFELASDGGQVTPDTVQTDEQGLATATVRLGQEPGAHPVEAVVVDATGLRVRFILTAFAPAPRPPTSGSGGGGDDGGGDGGNGGNDNGGNGGGGSGG
ncbi:MAG TPA: hypothetical protein VEB59_14050, partial [Gemmatimonadales bacterium]|nr:hypothetical protein [Gemmatimonadales bacterium]